MPEPKGDAMVRTFVLFLFLALGLAACDPGPAGGSGGGYRISDRDRSEVQNRMLEAVNFNRLAAGAAPLSLDPQLTAASEAQALDMSRQQRVWGFSSDNASPYQRVQRAGYPGTLVNEIYSQSKETELETLQSWLADPAWGPAILDPDATDMGFAWHQDRGGVFWWVLTLGKRGFGLDG